MSRNKYISTKEAVRLTGLSPQDLTELELIQDGSDTIVEEALIEDGFIYVADDEHYNTDYLLPKQITLAKIFARVNSFYYICSIF